MSSIVFPLANLVSMRIAKLFWNLSFKVEELQFEKLQTDYEYNWEILLTTFRDEAISKVKIFVKNEKYHEFIKTTITESIFFLHLAYHQLVLWKNTYDSENKIDLLKEGEHYAPNYFSANGKFNDVLWTKNLMHDPRYSLARRFKLATAYFFAEDITTLWEKLLTLDDVPYEDGFEYFGLFKHEFRQFKQIMNIDGRNLDIHDDLILFQEIASKGYEHAVYCMWRRMTESNKNTLMENNKFFTLISRGLRLKRFDLGYFLYSQLTEERKNDFMGWSIQSLSTFVWLPLLLTPYMEQCRTEILEIVYEQPIKVLSWIMEQLSYRINHLKLPSDAHMFRVLWERISLDEKNYAVILRKDKHVIENLVKAESFYLVGCIIKMLPREKKRKCLFEDLFGAGTNILDILCQSRKYHLLENYLNFFLTDIDFITKKTTLCRNGVLFFDRFKKSSGFNVWCKNKTVEVENEVRRLIYDIQASYTVLRDNCRHKSVKTKDSGSLSKISTFEEFFVENR